MKKLLLVLAFSLPLAAQTLNGVSNQSVVGVTSSPAYVAGGGTANAQTATYSPAITSLTAGLEACWLPVAANTTTTPTFSPNGLTAKTITKFGTGALAASDLTTTAIACAVYDGTTNWQLKNPQTATGGGATLPAYTQPSTSVPTVASLTAVNQSTATATDTGSGIYMVQPSTATQYIFGLFQNTPGSTWTYTAAIEAPIWPTSGIADGVCITDGTKIITFGAEYNGGAYPNPIIYYVTKWNSATSYNADYTGLIGFPLNVSAATAWYRIQDDGTNLTYSVSYDGVNFVQVKQTLHADFLTTSKIGVCVKAQNASGVSATQTVSSWKATTP